MCKGMPEVFAQFDLDAVYILNGLLRQTKIDIVITSDWKRSCTLEYMQDFYKSQGVIKSPIDFTIDYRGDLREQRAAGILRWVDLHQPYKWVVVDDLDLQLINFVRTNPNVGICEESIVKSILGYIEG